MTGQLAIDFSRIETAHQRAQSKVEREHAGWTAQAEALMAQFLIARPDDFLVQEFAVFAESRGLPEPSNSRVYGVFIKHCQRHGWVKPAGFGRDQFGSPKTLWRRQ